MNCLDIFNIEFQFDSKKSDPLFQTPEKDHKMEWLKYECE